MCCTISSLQFHSLFLICCLPEAWAFCAVTSTQIPISGMSGDVCSLPYLWPSLPLKVRKQLAWSFVPIFSFQLLLFLPFLLLFKSYYADQSLLSDLSIKERSSSTHSLWPVDVVLPHATLWMLRVCVCETCFKEVSASEIYFGHKSSRLIQLLGNQYIFPLISV